MPKPCEHRRGLEKYYLALDRFQSIVMLCNSISKVSFRTEWGKAILLNSFIFVYFCFYNSLYITGNIITKPNQLSAVRKQLQ